MTQQTQRSVKAIAVSALDAELLNAELLNASLRLVRLIDSANQYPPLAPLIIREIVYRLQSPESFDCEFRLHFG